MAGEDLNYYYLGHLMAAGLLRLSGVAPDVGYNLAVATFFALSVVAAFGLAYALGERIAIGLWGVALCVVAGTIGSGLELLQDGGPLRTYDWFGASRVIEGTINEFPAFSFTLADLHGHVMAIPFSLLALAFGLQLAIARARPPPPRGPAALELVRRGDRDRDAVRDQRLVVPGRRGPVRARRAGAACATAPTLRERVRTLAWTLVVLAARRPRRAAVPAHLRRGRRRPRHASTERAPFATWARDHGALYGLFAYLVVHGLPRQARALATTRGGRRAGRLRRRCSPARCWRPRTSPAWPRSWR